MGLGHGDRGGESPGTHASEFGSCTGDTGCTTYGDGQNRPVPSEVPTRSMADMPECPVAESTSEASAAIAEVPFERKREAQLKESTGKQNLFNFELCLANTAASAPVPNERVCVSRYLAKRVVDVMDQQLTHDLRSER